MADSLTPEDDDRSIEELARGEGCLCSTCSLYRGGVVAEAVVALGGTDGLRDMLWGIGKVSAADALTDRILGIRRGESTDDWDQERSVAPNTPEAGALLVLAAIHAEAGAAYLRRASMRLGGLPFNEKPKGH